MKLSKKTKAGFTGNIPDDVVITHIFPHLDFKTLVRCRGVCRAWRRFSYLSPHPWLCVSPAPTTTTTMPCMSHLGLSEGDHVVGSYGQFMILTSETSIMVYNPFTGQKFPLPMKTMKLNSNSLYRDTVRLPLRLAQISSPPVARNGSCIVAAVDNVGTLCICRLGIDLYWTRVYMDRMEYCHGYNITELIFFKNKLFFTIKHVIFDHIRLQPLLSRGLILPKRRSDIDFPLMSVISTRGRFRASHMMVSCGEVLMILVFQQTNPGGDSLLFRVYKLGKGNEFVPLDDLGGRMLFVGRGCSRSWSDEDSSDGFFTKNCIYYVSDCSNFACMDGYCSCDRDKVRDHRLCKWSIVANKVVGDLILVSSLTYPTWVTPTATLF